MLHVSRECWEHALPIFQKAYGRKHPLVATVLSNLGKIWLDLGDSTQSKGLLEEALAIQEEIYGPDHCEVSYCSNAGEQ